MSNFKNRICEFSNINVFKHEESDKASVDSTHTEGVYGGESIDSPTASILHSPVINVEYVFCLFKYHHHLLRSF